LIEPLKKKRKKTN